MGRGSDMKHSIGIDIGGTKCAVLLGDPQGSESPEKFILHKEVFETKKAGGPLEVIQKMKELIHGIISKESI